MNNMYKYTPDVFLVSAIDMNIAHIATNPNMNKITCCPGPNAYVIAGWNNCSVALYDHTLPMRNDCKEMRRPLPGVPCNGRGYDYNHAGSVAHVYFGRQLCYGTAFATDKPGRNIGYN